MQDSLKISSILWMYLEKRTKILRGEISEILE